MARESKLLHQARSQPKPCPVPLLPQLTAATGAGMPPPRLSPSGTATRMSAGAWSQMAGAAAGGGAAASRPALGAAAVPAGNRPTLAELRNDYTVLPVDLSR